MNPTETSRYQPISPSKPYLVQVPAKVPSHIVTPRKQHHVAHRPMMNHEPTIMITESSSSVPCPMSKLKDHQRVIVAEESPRRSVLLGSPRRVPVLGSPLRVPVTDQNAAMMTPRTLKSMLGPPIRVNALNEQCIDVQTSVQDQDEVEGGGSDGDGTPSPVKRNRVILSEILDIISTNEKNLFQSNEESEAMTRKQVVAAMDEPALHPEEPVPPATITATTAADGLINSTNDKTIAHHTTPSKMKHRETPFVVREVDGGTALAYTPVRLSSAQSQSLGSSIAVTPVRRSARKLAETSARDLEERGFKQLSSVGELLDECGWVYVPNESFKVDNPQMPVSQMMGTPGKKKNKNRLLNSEKNFE